MKPCITAGCRSLVTRLRCASCERAFQRNRNADPKRAAYADPAYRAMKPHGPCAVLGCGRPATQRDHIIPLVRGGSNAPENIRFLCAHHNASKGGKDAQHLHD